MRRGFKAWCETAARDYRSAVGIRVDQPIDVDALAAHLNIDLWLPSDVPDLADSSLRQLTTRDPESWSAVTLHVGRTRLTIVNSAHATTRQRSSIVHEFAHVILDHAPGRIDLSPAGHLLLSSFEKEQEEEADWLAGAILVPREGLQIMFRRRSDARELAGHFRVSVDLLLWRLRMTGVAVQARRAARLGR